MTEARLRAELVEFGRSLFERGLTPGRTGNLSVRLGDQVLISPTGSSLGALDPGELSLTDLDGRIVSGSKPSKELPLHLAMYRARSEWTAVAHLHSPYAVALATLENLDADDVLPALTPYFVMRVGRLPLLPYARPGSDALANSLSRLPSGANAALLANHGSIAGGASLAVAVDAVEEIEATAHVYLLTRGQATRTLTDAQASELRT